MMLWHARQFVYIKLTDNVANRLFFSRESVCALFLDLIEHKVIKLDSRARNARNPICATVSILPINKNDTLNPLVHIDYLIGTIARVWRDQFRWRTLRVLVPSRRFDRGLSRWLHEETRFSVMRLDSRTDRIIDKYLSAVKRQPARRP